MLPSRFVPGDTGEGERGGYVAAEVPWGYEGCLLQLKLKKPKWRRSGCSRFFRAAGVLCVEGISAWVGLPYPMIEVDSSAAAAATAVRVCMWRCVYKT